GDLAQEEGREAEARARGPLRVVGEGLLEHEAAGRVRSVGEVEADPALVRAHLERVAPAHPGEAVRHLHDVRLAVPAREPAASRSEGKHARDVDRWEGVGRDYGREAERPRPVAAE